MMDEKNQAAYIVRIQSLFLKDKTNNMISDHTFSFFSGKTLTMPPKIGFFFNFKCIEN